MIPNIWRSTANYEFCPVCFVPPNASHHPQCKLASVNQDEGDKFELVNSKSEMVDHPAHYGGGDNPYEAVKVIEAWELGWHLGDATKYISRAGKKNPDKEIEDLEKAVWYIERRIALLRSLKS